MATLLKEIAVGAAYGTWYLRLYEDSVSQNIAANTSSIPLRLTMRCSANGATISFDSRDAWINTTHFTPAYTQTAAEHDIGSTTITVNHNADGTGSYSVGFGITTSYIVSGSSTAGRTLPTIPRASSISSISGSTLGSAVTVNISRASSSFTHKVRYQFGSIAREYTGQATSCAFTPPLTDAAQIPSAVSGTASVTVTTYNGSTQIGDSVTSYFTLNLPASVIPTFTSLGIARVDNGVPAAWAIYVQNKSKATLTVNGAAGIYGSTIKAYSISGGGYSTTASSFTTGVLGAGTITFTATITDSRGRSASKSVSITVYDNALPGLTLKAERCNSAGVVNNAGTYVKVTPTYSCASVNGKNYIASKSFKITGTSYANTTAASGAGFVLGNNDIAVSKSYQITGVVADALGQSSGTITFTVSSSAVPFNLRDDGNGAAFGKYAETANRLDSAWPIYMQGKSLIDLFMPIGSVITNASGSFNPNTLYPGTTWVRIKGRVIVGIDEADGDFSVNGKTGGAKTFNNSHTHTTGSLSLTIAQMPSHDHGAGSGAYFHTYVGSGGSDTVSGGSNFKSTARTDTNGSGQAHNHGATGAAGLSAQSLLQPYIAKFVWERTA